MINKYFWEEKEWKQVPHSKQVAEAKELLKTLGYKHNKHMNYYSIDYEIKIGDLMPVPYVIRGTLDADIVSESSCPVVAVKEHMEQHHEKVLDYMSEEITTILRRYYPTKL